MTRPVLCASIAFLTPPRAAVQTWTSITPYVSAVQTQRGRQGELDRDEAGTASVTLQNNDRRFDPTYTDSPYYPYVLPMRRIRIGATLDTDPRMICPGTALSLFVSEDTAAEDYKIEGALRFTARLSADAWDTATRRQIFRSDTGTGSAFAIAVKDGALEFLWQDAGTGLPDIAVSDPLPAYEPGSAHWIRVELDGLAEKVFFDVSEDGASWTSLGIVSIGYVPQIEYSPPERFYLGSTATLSGWDGSIYTALLERRPSGGYTGDFEEVMRFDFTLGAVWSGDTSSGDETGHAWANAPTSDITFSSVEYIFSGFILKWPQEWPTKRSATVTISCVDAFHALALYKVSADYPAEASNSRVTNVLNDISWPSLERSIAAGSSTIIATEVRDTPAIEHLYHVAESEMGRIFINRAGKVVFYGRNTVPLTDLGIFGDADGELRYLDMGEASYTEENIYNNVNVSTASGDYQNRFDGASEAEFLQRTLTRSNLLLASDSEAASTAALLLYRYKDARLRIESLELDGELDSATLWPIILTAELGNTATVRRRPPGGGAYIEQESALQAIAHDIAPAWWRATWALAPDTRETFFTLNDNEFGILNESILGY